MLPTLRCTRQVSRGLLQRLGYCLAASGGPLGWLRRLSLGACLPGGWQRVGWYC